MRLAALVLAILLSGMTLIQAHHKARKGQNALRKWRPYAERLEAGEPIYGIEAEGYPTLPLSLLGLRPFLSAGPILGPVLWAAFEIALAWWVLLQAFRLAAGRARDFPPWGLLAVLALSYRVLASEVLHGNVNLAVGATVVLAMSAWAAGRRFLAGVAIGLGTVLKVTPALFLLYWLRQRSARGLLGFITGIVVFGLFVPALFLGWSENLALAQAWWQQMVTPYLAGRELSLLQTEHINQSLLGVLSRLFTDAVAIPANPPQLEVDVRVTLFALEPAAFRILHGILGLAVILTFLWSVRPSPRTVAWRVLGEFALGALAMVFLSERSWKHHYVLLALPLAFLVAHVAERRRRGATAHFALAAIIGSALLHGLTGSGVLGHHGSNLAEAYGAHLCGGLLLFAACAFVLVRARAATASLGDVDVGHPSGSNREEDLLA